MKRLLISTLFVSLVACGSYPDGNQIKSRTTTKSTQTSFDQEIQSGEAETKIETQEHTRAQDNFKEILAQPLSALKWFNSENTIASAKTTDGMVRLIRDLPDDTDVELGDFLEKINTITPLHITSDNYQENLPNLDLSMLVFSMANQAAIDQGYIKRLRAKNFSKIDINQVLLVVQVIAKVLELFSDDSVQQERPLDKLLTLLNNPILTTIKEKIEGIFQGRQDPVDDQVYAKTELPNFSEIVKIADVQNYSELRESYAAHIEYAYRTYEDTRARNAIVSIYKIAYSQIFTKMQLEE